MNNNENLAEATTTAVFAGSQFLKDYHTSVETNRERLLEVFRENSVLLWNGTKIVGVAAIVAFLNGLPLCMTRTASVDVQVLRCESHHNIHIHAYSVLFHCVVLSFFLMCDGDSGRRDRDSRNHQQRQHHFRREQSALLHRVARRRAQRADQRVCSAHSTLPPRLVKAVQSARSALYFSSHCIHSTTASLFSLPAPHNIQTAKEHSF